MDYNNKSKTCLKKDRTPKAEYYSEAEAERAAKYVKERYENDVVPYKCDECQWWHLCPKDRHPPHEWCKSCGKNLYYSEDDAQKRADIIYEEQEIPLKVYPCEYDEGWHLTSQVDDGYGY